MMYVFKFWKSIVFIICIIAITSALIAEFVFNILPCKMCLNQRYAYYFIIIIIIISYLYKNFSKKLLFFFVEIGLLYGLFYSIWHVGIEQKILSGPASCSGQLNISNNTSDLKNQIIKQEIINCEEITWTIFNLSAATLNAILMLMLILFNTIYIFKLYNNEKEKI